jgi:non-ribosomal peptide synthetase component F
MNAPDGLPLHAIVAWWAKRIPESVALIDAGRPTTYADLDARASSLAACLKRSGARRGTVVAVVLPHSADLVATILAVLRTGAAYAALDPTWPQAYRRKLLARLNPVFVVDGPFLAGIEVVGPVEPLDTTVGDESACCVFFTSGTTGEPKGSISSHRAILRVVANGNVLNHPSPPRIPLPWNYGPRSLMAGRP